MWTLKWMAGLFFLKESLLIYTYVDLVYFLILTIHLIWNKISSQNIIIYLEQTGIGSQKRYWSFLSFQTDIHIILSERSHLLEIQTQTTQCRLPPVAGSSVVWHLASDQTLWWRHFGSRWWGSMFLSHCKQLKTHRSSCTRACRHCKSPCVWTEIWQ